MIEFNYELDFSLLDELKLADWIESAIVNEKYHLGPVNYIFCNDGFYVSIFLRSFFFNNIPNSIFLGCQR